MTSTALLLRGRRGSGALMLASPLMTLFTVVFAIPVGLLVWISLWRYDPNSFGSTAPTLENYVRLLGDGFYLRILGRTLLLGVVTTAVTLLVAYPMAVVLTLVPPRLRSALFLLLLTPLLMSVVVRVFGWMVILGSPGILNNLLMFLGIIDAPVRILGSMSAVVIGLAQVEMAFAVIPIYAALGTASADIRQAARTLGAGPLTTFAQVTLPLSLPGVHAAATLIFSLSMAAFVQPQLLGGSSFMVMTTLIYEQVSVTLNWPFAAAAGVVLLAAALASLLVMNRLFRALQPWEEGR